MSINESLFDLNSNILNKFFITWINTSSFVLFLGWATMAEVVQRHLEDMLNEFEQAKRIGLFTEAEIKYVDYSERESERD